jgi:glutathione synthase/RimK-type ligase-like ATP-grasp enzyme
MGSFSWNKADKLTAIENVACGSSFKFLIPKEFGGEFIKDNDFSLTKKIELLKAKYPSIWAGDIVLKPIISADGDDTYRFTTDQQLISKDKNRYKPFSAADSIMKDLITRKDSRGVIIQPFIPSVEKSGEYQLVFIGGNFSHATVKPKGFKNNNTNERQPVSPEALPKCMYEFANKISTTDARPMSSNVM